uniref:Uncharacterized protein n=1 Tax=Tetranychus urticae TaxID=32264 RepID=T1JX26_TETUR
MALKFAFVRIGVLTIRTNQILSSKSKSNQQIQGVPDTKPLSSPRKDSLFDLDGFNNSPPPSQPLEQQRPKSLPNLPSIDSKFHDQGSRLENKPVPSKKLGWDYEPDFDVFHKGPQGVVRSWHTKDGKGDDHIWHTKETHHHHHHHHHHASEEDHEHEHGHKHDNWHKHDHKYKRKVLIIPIDGVFPKISVKCNFTVIIFFLKILLHQNHGHENTHAHKHGHEHQHDNKHSHQHGEEYELYSNLVKFVIILTLDFDHLHFGHEHWHDHDHKHGHDHHHHHDHEHHSKHGGKEEEKSTDTQSHLAALLENLAKSQNNQPGYLIAQKPVQIRQKKRPNSRFKISLDGAAIDLGNLI